MSRFKWKLRIACVKPIASMHCLLNFTNYFMLLLRYYADKCITLMCYRILDARWKDKCTTKVRIIIAAQ